MAICKATQENIKKAAAVIRGGGLVSFPTETVYGLGSDAFNPSAVAGIFEAKNRPFFDPVIVHISEHGQLPLVADIVTDTIERIAGSFWPGPLTVVMEKSSRVPDIVTAGLPTVAVRMPDHPVARELIDMSGTLIAAPSANRFGSVSPTEAAHVEEQLGDRVGMILDGGRCRVGIESTIIKLDREGAILLRPGGVSLEDLERELGPVRISKERMIEAPGQLPYHYSPGTPVVLVERISGEHQAEENAAFLYFRERGGIAADERVAILSPSGNLREAAANLFSALHRLDRTGADVIIAEKVPETGLGLAIMDRLRKASWKKKEGD